MRSIRYQWDLLTCLVQRDIKMNYRRSVLGILWAQLNPLLSLIIFSFVFQQVVPLKIPDYPVYVFSGLLAWNWFSTCINQANYSLINSRDLVRKPQFSTEMILVVSVAANMVNFILALPVLLVLLLISGLIPNWTVIFLPLVLLVQFLFTLGLAFIFSSLNVFFRDMLHIVAVLVTSWFYITPIFYRADMRSDYAFIINLNPMTHIIAAYRSIWMYGSPPDFVGLGIVGIIAGLIFLVGLRVFGTLKYSFVDEL